MISGPILCFGISNNHECVWKFDDFSNFPTTHIVIQVTFEWNYIIKHINSVFNNHEWKSEFYAKLLLKKDLNFCSLKSENHLHANRNGRIGGMQVFRE